MADPFRNLRLYWHRLLNTQHVNLDGVNVKSDTGQARQIRNLLFKRTYEGPERELVSKEVRPGDTVLEIGAGIGFVGLLAARLSAPGRVVSFEANPALEPVILANYALNAARPELHMKAVTTDGAPITFHTSSNVISSSLIKRPMTQQSVTVHSTAIATAIDEIRPDVLIMDAEGAEIDLLTAYELGALRAIIVELHPHIVGDQATERLMTSLSKRGFTAVEKVGQNVLLHHVA